MSKDKAVNVLRYTDLNEKSGALKNIKFSCYRLNMGKEIIAFNIIEIEKHKFHCNKIFFKEKI